MSRPGSLLLTLHAVRLLGFAGTKAIAERFNQDENGVQSQLIDAGARGLVSHTSFAGTRGWSLSGTGRTENERLLAQELEGAGARGVVTAAHHEFVGLNTAVVTACSVLQLQQLSGTARPEDGSEEQTRTTLLRAAASLGPIEARLAAVLPRFMGYTGRLTQAWGYAAKDAAWITATDRDSFHRVWFELHEDLIATLGIQR